MNQILNVGDNNKKEKEEKESDVPIEIHKILRFFAIAILVFGICMIGTGSYSMYQEAVGGTNKTKPIIYVEQISKNEITLKATHEKGLEAVTYDWNEEGQIGVQANGQAVVQTTIEIPTGTNTLRIYAKGTNGQEITYEKVYTVESDININIEPEGNNLKVTANGINNLQYMTYRWDDEDETRVDIEGKEVEEIIEIPRGLHKLTVIAVDEKNQTETKEQEVNGVTKPKLEVTTDGSSNFIIKASDEDGIKKVQFIINEEEKYELDLEAQLAPEDRKEFEYAYPLHDGKNKLEVIVYNNSDITENFKAMVTK